MIQILIQMDDSGKVNVSGPLENKILCYGLLEIAKDVIKNYEPKSKIVIPDLKIVPRRNDD